MPQMSILEYLASKDISLTESSSKKLKPITNAEVVDYLNLMQHMTYDEFCTEFHFRGADTDYNQALADHCKGKLNRQQLNEAMAEVITLVRIQNAFSDPRASIQRHTMTTDGIIFAKDVPNKIKNRIAAFGKGHLSWEDVL